MAINYSDLNLNLIDLSLNSSSDLFINTSGVSFSKKVLDDMNYPANVQLSIDPLHRVFAVRVCRVCDAKSVPFVKKDSKPGNTLCISNRNLKESITALIKDYDEKIRYKITGEWDREHRIMFFDISGAVECEFQPVKKK